MRSTLPLFALVLAGCPTETASDAGGGDAASALKTDKGVDAAAKVLKIGMLNDESGPAAAIGKPYAIGFALALPQEWNGRFLFQGGGGLNGSVAQPLGATAAGDIPALVRGFAVASTDSGHEGAHPFDGAFFEDQEATLKVVLKKMGLSTDVNWVLDPKTMSFVPARTQQPQEPPQEPPPDADGGDGDEE